MLFTNQIIDLDKLDWRNNTDAFGRRMLMEMSDLDANIEKVSAVDEPLSPDDTWHIRIKYADAKVSEPPIVLTHEFIEDAEAPVIAQMLHAALRATKNTEAEWLGKGE